MKNGGKESKGSIFSTQNIPVLITVGSLMFACALFYYSTRSGIKSAVVGIKEVSSKLDELITTVDRIDDRLILSNNQLNNLLQIHRAELIEYNQQVKKDSLVLNLREKKPTTVYTEPLNSPYHLSYTDEFYLEVNDIPFEGESLNGIWSPDMKKILFQGKKKNSNNYDIFIFNLETKGIIQLTNGEADNDGNFYDNKEPTFVPTGSEIIFASNRNGSFDIFKMYFDGSEQNSLIENNAVDLTLPAVSKCANWLGFSTATEEGWDLYIADLRTMKAERICEAWGYCRMKWNPTKNNEVIYVKDRREIKPLAGRDQGDIIIGELKLGKEGKFQIIEKINLTKTSLSNYPNCPSDNYPDWSNDGERVIFSMTTDEKWSGSSKNWFLYIINRDGTERHEYAGLIVHALFPDWIS